MKNKKGFTLIELLATVVILGVIIAIATVSINKVIKSSKADAFYKSAQVIKLTANTLCTSKNGFKAKDLKEELNADGIKIEISGKEIYVQYEDDSKYSNLELKNSNSEFTKIAKGYKFTVSNTCNSKTSTTESEKYTNVDSDITDSNNNTDDSSDDNSNNSNDIKKDDIDLLDVFYEKSKIVSSISEDICKDVTDEISEEDFTKQMEEKINSRDELKNIYNSDLGIKLTSLALEGNTEYEEMSKLNNKSNVVKMGLKKSDSNSESSLDTNVLIYANKNGIFGSLYGKDFNDIFKKRYKDSKYTWKIINIGTINLLGKSNFSIEKMGLIINKDGEEGSLNNNLTKYYGLAFKPSCKIKVSMFEQSNQGSSSALH